MLIHSASQLLTLAGGPQRGSDLGRLGIIPDGAVLLRDGRIAAVGTSAELRAAYPHEPVLDAAGKVVLPGFVDPHTHLIFAGDRAAEFELRLEGKTYLEILAAGGGILSTVRASRQATVDELVAQARVRARPCCATAPPPPRPRPATGWKPPASWPNWRPCCAWMRTARWNWPPPFWARTPSPPNIRTTRMPIPSWSADEMLPAAKRWWDAHGAQRPLPFVDVFCETGAFTLAQSRRILSAAKALGFPLKIHADEFDNLGGASLAAELGAVSADHLVKTSPADIAALARSGTVAVALPCTPFGLAEPHYTPARAILQAGGLLAIASDLNPGTAWCESMQFVIALACRYLRLTPAQAIAAATINAAAAIQRAERIGSLEVGKQADLMILSVDDYRQLGYRFGANLVEIVVKKGQIVVDANHQANVK